MCHNHSHIQSEITGTVLLGRNTMVEVRVGQQLAVLLPSGEKWIRPSGVHLLMPYSMRAVLPACTPAAMEVCYIPSYCSEENDTIMTPEMARKLKRAGVIGETVSRMTALFPFQPQEENDDVPW